MLQVTGHQREKEAMFNDKTNLLKEVRLLQESASNQTPELDETLQKMKYAYEMLQGDHEVSIQTM
jgi:hypothetical protein